MTARKRLLWIDDEGPGSFQYAEFRLRARGWDVTWAPTVADAARLLRAEPFDGVVIDQMMPLTPGGDESSVWSGCTLLRWLAGLGVAAAAPSSLEPPSGAPLAANSRAAIVMLSAYRHDDVERAALDAGPVPLLPKPLDVDALLTLLEAPP